MWRLEVLREKKILHTYFTIATLVSATENPEKMTNQSEVTKLAIKLCITKKEGVKFNLFLFE